MRHEDIPIGEPVAMVYTNYRGEHARRTVLPERVWFGATEWHPAPQWLLDAYDFDREALRSFALEDVEAIERVGNDVLDGRTAQRTPA